jgi:hypothetical protein
MMNTRKTIERERGGALPVALILLVIAAGLILASADHLVAQADLRARARSAAALAQARAALLGYAIHYAEEHPGQGIGYLPCPDSTNSGSPPGISCHGRDHGAFGRFPYRRLGLPPLRDGWEHCLWYAVAGSFKHSPKPLALNWDSPGQFEIVDSAGRVIGGAGHGAVAVVIAPGPPLPGQHRPPAATTAGAQRCPGSVQPAIDLPAFLDRPYPDDIVGGLEIVSGLPGSNVNDLVIWLTGDDMFGALRRRSDFAAMIDDILDAAGGGLTALLADPAALSTFLGSQAAFVQGNRAHGGFPTAADMEIAPESADSYDNWRDQLRFVVCTDGSACLVAELGDSALTPSPATVESCRALVIFGGERRRGANPQYRNTAAERADPAQYLEGSNLASFTAGSGPYAGYRHFAVVDPVLPASEELIRCLP